MNTNNYTLRQKLLAGSVHLFTSSGIVAGFMAMLAIMAYHWQEAAIWLIVCQIIDGVDGTLARRFRIKEVLPDWNGKNIDYVVDFCTYALIPALFMYQADLFPQNLDICAAAAVLLTSAMYYGKEGMVSSDNYFIGFPVLWNAVAVYLVFVWHWSPAVNFIFVLCLCVLHFIPIKFPYPSQMSSFRRLTIACLCLMALALMAIIALYPDRNYLLEILATVTAIYFFAISVWVTYKK